MLGYRMFLIQINILLFTICAINFSSMEGTDSGTKIYNGSSAVGHRYLKHAVFFRYGGGICGGAILTPKLILTAAHCVTLDQSKPLSDEDISEGKITAGSPLMNGMSPTAQIRSIKDIFVNEDYQKAGGPNDIAIIVMREALVEDGNTVQSIPIADGRTPIGTVCTIIGWGDITCAKETHQLPSSAQYTTLTKVSLKFCERTFPFPIRIGQFCAIDRNLNSETCRGDSGSPLVCNGKVVGVQSMGTGKIGDSSVLTDVLHYRKWITGIMKAENDKLLSAGARLSTSDFCVIFLLTFLIKIS